MPSIGGPTPPSNLRPGVTSSAAPASSRKKLGDPDQAKIYDKQREATSTADQIQGQINTMQRDGEVALQNVKNEYEREYTAETGREDNSLESQRLKGYEGIRDLKRQQEMELARIRREGESDVNRLSDYYRNATYHEQRRGDEQLKTLESQHAQQTSYEQHEGTTQLDQVRANEAQELANTMDMHSTRMAKLQKDSADQYEQKSLETEEAAKRTSQNLETRYHLQVSDQEHAVNRINSEGQQQLESIRADTARKISAYRDRQGDPFYQMVNIGANITDAGDHYVLTANVPTHEQKGISISVRGDQLVVQGTRKNEERLELNPGHSQSSSSFQSYSESFPMMDPVDPKRMTREFEGDQLIVRIPKKDPSLVYRPYKADVGRTRVQRPAFPANLPHVGDEPMPPTLTESPKTKGSGTLT